MTQCNCRCRLCRHDHHRLCFTQKCEIYLADKKERDALAAYENKVK